MRGRDVAAAAVAVCGTIFFLDKMDIEMARDIYPKLMYVVSGGTSLLGLFLFGLYKFQNHLLYFPNIPEDSRTNFTEPEEYERKGAFEEVFVETEDGAIIQCWLFKQSNTFHAPTFLYFHGNAGNISHRLLNIHDFYRKLKVNVFIVEYRGYGKSTTHPTEEGIERDAMAALRYLIFGRKDIDSKRIIFFGRSLGGAVAIDLAHKLSLGLSFPSSSPRYLSFPNCSSPSAPSPSSLLSPPPSEAEYVAGSVPYALIVENTFTSIPDMIDEIFPMLRFAKFLSQNIFDNRKKIQTISCPTLFLSGMCDELVPPRMMQELFDLVKDERKEMVRFTKGHHMDVWVIPGYYDNIKTFLHSLKEMEEDATDDDSFDGEDEEEEDGEEGDEGEEEEVVD